MLNKLLVEGAFVIIGLDPVPGLAPPHPPHLHQKWGKKGGETFESSFRTERKEKRTYQQQQGLLMCADPQRIECTGGFNMWCVPRHAGNCSIIPPSTSFVN
jgi:hypothetical protein